MAEKIANEQIKKKFKPKIFVQINIGKEEQKNGIDIENLEKFYLDCIKNYDLNIIGLMCLPPNDNDASTYFSKMLQLLKNTNLKELSMGMTNDYIDALKFNSTFLRIGSKTCLKKLIYFYLCFLFINLSIIKKSFSVKQYILLLVYSFWLNVKK